ncbi:MAG: hypothetical protein EA393_16305 [Bacteroidetes bacterium]|nr:MAG: hypothetical protein EA393_16305 [Bacteroidota bacterium]
MSLLETKENIVNLLENIIKRTELIERQSGSRNLLEIDLALEDVRDLYKELNYLRRLSENDQLNTASELRKAENNNPVTPEKQHTESVKEEKVQKPAEPVAQKVQPQQEEKIEEKPKETAKVQQETPAKPKVESQQVQKTATETEQKQKTVVGEKYTNGKSLIHERLAQIKEDKSIGTRMQYKPVKNIKEAIGVNEKFLFINELFNGDLKSYNESVEKLNEFPSIHEAFEFLNKLTYEFQWDGQRSAVTIEKFANLVQRRYM